MNVKHFYIDKPKIEKSSKDDTWLERKCLRLKAFLHDDFMKEHSGGFTLKRET
jgi:hypothetical protein